MSKFKVGQVWRDARGSEVVIASLDSGKAKYPIQDSEGYTYTQDGECFRDLRTGYDLVELVRDVDGSESGSQGVADSETKATRDELELFDSLVKASVARDGASQASKEIGAITEIILARRAL